MARVETRRASEEYGGKRPRKTGVGGGPTPWQRHMNRSRKVWRGTRKFYKRHKTKRGAVAMWGGAIGLGVLTGMWAFEGTVQVLTGAVCVGAMGAGYAVHRYDDAKVMRGTRRTTNADRLRHAAARTQPYRRPSADEPATDWVHVESHRRDGDGVKSYTRRRPGQAEGEQPGGGWSAADTKAHGKATPSSPPPRPTTSSSPTSRPRPSSGPSRSPHTKPRRSRKRGPSGRVLHQTENPNSNESDVELRKQGKCGNCGDRGFWNQFGHPGEWRHTYCPDCGA